MKITKEEIAQAKALLPKDLVVIRVQNDEGDHYNITVGKNLCGYFAYGQDIDEAHADDPTDDNALDEPESGEAWLEDILASMLVWAEGSVEFKRDYVVSPRETIAYLDEGEITLTQAGVDKWLKSEGWQPRKQGTRPLIERVHCDHFDY